MNDSQRRGAVVSWLRNVADPWIRTEHPPAAGSPLAGDDSLRPAVSELARFGIATAVDHLGLVVDAMEADIPFRHYGPLTTLRTALLVSSRIVWLLEPRRRTARQFRAARMELQNMIEQRKAINELTGDQMSAELVAARNQAVALLDEKIQNLEAHALTLCPGEKLDMPDAVSLIRDLVEPHSYVGQGIRHLWRTGSAVAHGYHWTNLGGGQFDEQSFNMSLYGSMMLVKDALELYEKRATNYLGSPVEC